MARHWTDPGACPHQILVGFPISGGVQSYEPGYSGNKQFFIFTTAPVLYWHHPDGTDWTISHRIFARAGRRRANYPVAARFSPLGHLSELRSPAFQPGIYPWW